MSLNGNCAHAGASSAGAVVFIPRQELRIPVNRSFRPICCSMKLRPCPLECLAHFRLAKRDAAAEDTEFEMKESDLNTTRRLFTSLKVTDDDGEVLFSTSDGLVSVGLPLQPTFVNPGFYPSLDARKWRHELTIWYDGELALLEDLRRDGSHYAADNLEVLLYGAFVKTAEQMDRRQLTRKSAYPKFKQSFNAFVQRYGHSPLCLNQSQGEMCRGMG